MIQKIEHITELDRQRNTPFACLICAAAEAYGVETPFAQFWKQEDHTMLCKLDDVMILDASSGTDFTEMEEFITMIGAKRLVCDGSIGTKLGFKLAVQSTVMTFCKSSTVVCPEHELNPSLREVHALLCACKSESFLPPEFEAFYMDMSHRIRHGTACTVGIQCEDTLVACALCPAKIEHTALLSGVGVLPNFRKQGLGASVVRALLCELTQETIYLFRAQNENKAFYQALGFMDCGTFAEFSLEGGLL